MKAVVTGAIATFGVGGVAWDYGQYALGLEQLGYDVWYLEDTGVPAYDPVARTYGDDPAGGIAFLRDALAELSPALADRWHVVDARGGRHGCAREEMLDVIGEADVLLNVSGIAVLRPEYARCRRTVLIDTDPGWNHWVALPRSERQAAAAADVLPWHAHDEVATYATRLGRAGCRLPDLGRTWTRTVPPVVLDRWTPSAEDGAAWTTVLTWDNYAGTFEADGVAYGSKASEMARIETLPAETGQRHELAVGGVDPPVERWRALGWTVVDGPSVTATPESYRAYVRASAGECSPAKHVYAASGSGWFSCRTACYLAAGRPAVVQDTGWSAAIPTAEGLHAWTDGAAAGAGIAAVLADPAAARQSARHVAETVFDARQVLADLLDGRDRP